jgi:predicted RNase H-like HicB family nuclease
VTAYQIEVLWNPGDAAWVASVPRLPYRTAHGATPEAVAEVEDAAQAWVEAARMMGRPVPVASARTMTPSPESRKVGGMLVTITQRTAQQPAYRDVEVQGEPCAGFQEEPVLVVGAGQQAGRVGVSAERFVVLGVVPLARGASLGMQCRVEVIVRAILAGAGRYQPGADLSVRIVGEDGAAPPAPLDLEQDDIIDGPDPLVRSVRTGELLAGLPQQG